MFIINVYYCIVCKRLEVQFYDLFNDEAINTFKKVKGIKNSLYKNIYDITKKNYVETKTVNSVENKILKSEFVRHKI